MAVPSPRLQKVFLHSSKALMFGKHWCLRHPSFWSTKSDANQLLISLANSVKATAVGRLEEPMCESYLYDLFSSGVTVIYCTYVLSSWRTRDNVRLGRHILDQTTPIYRLSGIVQLGEGLKIVGRPHPSGLLEASYGLLN